MISIKLLCNFTTVLRAINKADYKSRKKGILSKRDIAKRFRYYKDTLKNKIGPTQARFMMTISYDGPIVMCEQSKSITSLKFVKTMDNCLPKTFDLNINPMTDGLFRTEMLAKTLQCPMKLWKI